MPENWFCLKVKNKFVGFLILQISHKSYSSLSSESFSTDFYFMGILSLGLMYITKLTSGIYGGVLIKNYAVCKKWINE